MLEPFDLCVCAQMSIYTVGWWPFKVVSLEKHGALAHCIYMSDSLSINTLRIFCSPPIL